MKKSLYKSLYIALILIVVGVVAGGCRRTSHNGLIDGHWQVLTMEDVNTGEVIDCKDRYVAVNLELIQLFKGDPATALYSTGYIYYTKGEDKFTVDFPEMGNNTKPERLIEFGITSNPQTLTIVKLDHKTFTYRSDAYIVTCRRY